jgi:hypothetical protein
MYRVIALYVCDWGYMGHWRRALLKTGEEGGEKGVGLGYNGHSRRAGIFSSRCRDAGGQGKLAKGWAAREGGGTGGGGVAFRDRVNVDNAWQGGAGLK